MCSDVLNKPKQGTTSQLDSSYFKNVPGEYNDEVERNRTHTLLLPKDKQAILEK